MLHQGHHQDFWTEKNSTDMAYVSKGHENILFYSLIMSLVMRAYIKVEIDRYNNGNL